MQKGYNMKKIAVTGANGYLASLVMKSNAGKYEFIPLTRKDIELSEPAKVKEFFENLDFDVVLHTAADATTAHCEETPELTHRINTESTIAIADVCKAKGKRFIFLSTEQCFNGKTVEGPFKEEEELVAVTNYGLQKKEADEYIRANLEDYVILRLSWMMGLPMPGIKVSPNIIKNVANALAHEKPTLFTVNEVRGMTYMRNLADQFDKIVELPTDVYNFTAENTLNTYEAAKLVAKKFGASEETIAKIILPNTERYKDRFRDYRLDNTKIKEHGIVLTNFEEDVEACLKDFGWM